MLEHLDISGLAKPLIFKAVLRELSEKGRILICHAASLRSYPLDEDLERLFAAKNSDEPVQFLESLAEILTGEKGGYDAIKLMDDQSDPLRSRALIAFSSPKHQRLFNLLDKREFDLIEVVAPIAVNSRARVSSYAADCICQNYPNAAVERIDTTDLKGTISYLDSRYLELYGNAGSNLKIGLTGSKTQAVAAAVIAARRKVSQAWYLSPREFDEQRFSSGVGSIRIFEISTR